MKRFLSACLAVTLLCTQLFAGVALAAEPQNVKPDNDGYLGLNDGGSYICEGNVTYTVSYPDFVTAAEVSCGTELTITGNVTSNVNGVRADAGSTVNVGGKVTADRLGVGALDSAVTVDGDVGGNSGVIASNSSAVTVKGNVTGTLLGVRAIASTVEVTNNVTSQSGEGVWANFYSTVTVGGYVEGITGVYAADDDTKVTVNGNVTGTNGNGINASRGATVTVKSDDPTVMPEVKGAESGVYAANDDTKVTVNGNVTGTNGNGITAEDGATVTVKSDDPTVVPEVKGDKNGVKASDTDTKITVYGDVTGTTAEGIYAEKGATVEVKSDDPTVVREVEGYHGVYAANTDTKVTVNGNVTGTDANGITAEGGATVTVDGDVEADADGIEAVNGASVEVKGSVTSHNWYGIEADQSTVIVGGSVEGGLFGISAKTGSSVSVGGDVDGTVEAVRMAAYGGTTVEIAGDVNNMVRLHVGNKNDGVLVVEGSIESNISGKAPICIAGYDAVLGTLTDMPTVEVFEIVPENGKYVEVESNDYAPTITEAQKTSIADAFLSAIKYIINFDKTQDFDVSVDQSYTSADKEKDYLLAKAGDTLTISAKNAGYEVSSVTVGGKAVTQGADGSWKVLVQHGGGLDIQAIISAIVPVQPPVQPAVQPVADAAPAAARTQTRSNYPIGVIVHFGSVGGDEHRWRIVDQDRESYTLALLRGLEKMPESLSEFCTEPEMLPVIPGTFVQLEGRLYTRYFNDGLIHPCVRVYKNQFEIK